MVLHLSILLSKVVISSIARQWEEAVLNQENILAGKEKAKSLIEKGNMVNLKRVEDLGKFGGN